MNYNSINKIVGASALTANKYGIKKTHWRQEFWDIKTNEKRNTNS